MTDLEAIAKIRDVVDALERKDRLRVVRYVFDEVLQSPEHVPGEISKKAYLAAMSLNDINAKPS